MAKPVAVSGLVALISPFHSCQAVSTVSLLSLFLSFIFLCVCVAVVQCGHTLLCVSVLVLVSRLVADM